jgi:hypothetical protein
LQRHEERIEQDRAALRVHLSDAFPQQQPIKDRAKGELKASSGAMPLILSLSSFSELPCCRCKGKALLLGRELVWPLNRPLARERIVGCGKVTLALPISPSTVQLASQGVSIAVR